MNPININNIVTNREFLVENEKFKTLFFKFEDGKVYQITHTMDLQQFKL